MFPQGPPPYAFNVSAIFCQASTRALAAAAVLHFAVMMALYSSKVFRMISCSNGLKNAALSLAMAQRLARSPHMPPHAWKQPSGLVEAESLHLANAIRLTRLTRIKASFRACAVFSPRAMSGNPGAALTAGTRELRALRRRSVRKSPPPPPPPFLRSHGNQEAHRLYAHGCRLRS